MNNERISDTAPYPHLMMDPAPGQKLQNGELAPATYAAAWDQQFAPLHAYEQKTGRKTGSFLSELDNEYLRLMHLEGSWGSSARVFIQFERLGMILQLRIPESNDACASTEIRCENQECISEGCMIRRAGRHQGFLGFDYGLNELKIDFALPAEIYQAVNNLRDELAPIQNLFNLREEARLAPWRIFEHTAKVEVADLPEVKAAQKRFGKAVESAARYNNILDDGRTDFRAMDDPQSLSYELAMINRSMGALSNKHNWSRQKNSREIKESHQIAYEQHETTLKTIASIEEKLGEALPECIKAPALEVHENMHRTYFYGAKKGASRRRTIINARARALALKANCLDELEERFEFYRARCQWGAGWPAGAVNAPDIDVWAKQTGLDLQELDVLSH